MAQFRTRHGSERPPTPSHSNGGSTKFIGVNLLRRRTHRWTCMLPISTATGLGAVSSTLSWMMKIDAKKQRRS